MKNVMLLMLLLFPVIPMQGAETPAWRELEPIPDKEGFAAAFVGVSDGALVVAGGANITGDRWKDPLAKTWYDSIFVLEKPDGRWQAAGKLPRPLAYGFSITTSDGLVCLGGSDQARHFHDAFRMTWKKGQIGYTPLPDLPKPCAQGCGAMVGQTIYLAGGLESPSSTKAMKTFWALDLAQDKLQWRELEPWPGPERMLAVAAVQDESFYLFSGTQLHADAQGKVARKYLTDGYRYTPKAGWQKLADLPRAVVAAPSPAIPLSDSELMIVSGDDGTTVNFSPLEKHPGFPRGAIVYDIRHDRWRDGGPVPFSLATAPVVFWNNSAVIINGEERPRVRSRKLWSLSIP